MKQKIIFALLILFCTLQNNIKAQQINSLYFLENIPVRHTLNPSFIPQNDVYISLPFAGLSQFSVGNNSISLSDVLYPQNGVTVTFLDNLMPFYDVLKSPVSVNLDIQANLLGVGFRQKSAFWSFAISEKLNSFINIPIDFFNVPLWGTTNSATYDFSDLNFDITKYTEVAFGYSRPISEKVVLGAKLKLNLGTANLSNVNNSFLLNVQNNVLNLKGTGVLNSTKYLPVNTLNLSAFDQNFMDFLTPNGVGLGVDFGVNFKINDKMNLSGAIVDLGFIGWSKSTLNYNYAVNYNTNSIAPYQQTSTSSSLFQVPDQFLAGTTFDETLAAAFDVGAITDSTSGTYFTKTKAKINLGFEYKLIEKYLSLGVFSNTNMYGNIFNEELTLSAITNPKEWFNAAISYSFINGSNSFGLGIGLRTGFFHWFIAADYIPYNTYPISNISFYNNSNVNFPSEIKSFNISAGMNLVFNTPNKDNEIARNAQRISGLGYSNKNASESQRKGRYVKPTLFKKSTKGLHMKTNNDCHCN